MGSGAKRLDRFRPPGPSGNFNLDSGLARLNRGATGCSSRVHLGSAHTHSSLVSGGSSANVTGAAIRRAKGAHRTNILNVHFGSEADTTAGGELVRFRLQSGRGLVRSLQTKLQTNCATQLG